MFFKKDAKPDEPPPTSQTAPNPALSARAVPPSLKDVTNIVAVASGKGGVGKSTVSTNLAVALHQLGYSVGLLDADIYGPSQPGMLGAGRSRAGITEQQQLKPVNRYGIDFISIGLLLEDDSPVIWRAPIAMKMIMQFIGAVAWGKRDYLIIDLPPGTGDVQLTLSQQAALTGAVIVTTPQQVALGVAKKGLKMFEQVRVPVLGIIENMSGFTCESCGHVTSIFKEGGGRQLAGDLGVPFLGALPLDPAIMQSGDDGVPVLINGTDSRAAQSFLSIARRLHNEIENRRGTRGVDEPTGIELAGDGHLVVIWPEGPVMRFAPYDLRIKCACAQCIDEDTGKKILDAARVPLDIKINSFKPIGRYGLSVTFSDGHSTGIYTYDHLKSISGSKPAAGSFDV
jgi:ATP-binding protein involved in chromosome partitioning